MSELKELSWEDVKRYNTEIEYMLPDACLNTPDNFDHICDRKKGHEGPHADLIRAKEWK